MTKEAYLKLIEDKRLRTAAVKAIALVGWPAYTQLMKIDATTNKLPPVSDDSKLPKLLKTKPDGWLPPLSAERVAKFLKPRPDYKLPCYMVDKKAVTSQAQFERFGPYTPDEVRAVIAVVRGFKCMRMPYPYPKAIQEMQAHLLALDGMRLPYVRHDPTPVSEEFIKRVTK